MKTIFNNIGKVLRKQRGFTLVEMVTVVAIMGVTAAVAVPMVSSQLGKAKEKSYLQDRAMIQTTVDSFFTAADNVRYLGQRQYPIEGTDSTGDAVLWANAGSDGSVASAGNPLRGVQGGEPQWNDDGDGTREAGEETLNGADDAASGTGPGWFVAQVTFQSESYAADSQDYFIDFEKLVTAGLLQQAPESASPDNGGGSTEGSYSWYVKKTGQIESLFYHLPSNGVSPFGGLDLRNFVDGVYP
ncbi:MAG: type II secretion system protein [Dehalococcoidia bacterium]|nr:type II secretion system protein [Dehalococcoidia bacterium]